MIYETAYAKINLGLQVLNQRNDGYHNLKMIMTSIDLFDELYFEKNKSLVLECDKNICDTEDNLVYKTANLMKDKFNIVDGAKIKLMKKIRSGAGLAGGSSDAAATIRGLNRLWGLNLNYKEMLELSKIIGSDVAFCLTGKISCVEGTGEIVSPLVSSSIEGYVVLVYPNYVSYTSEVFNRFRVVNYYDEQRFIKLKNSIENQNIKNTGLHLFNDLERTVNAMNIDRNDIPIYLIKDYLIKNGCIGAVMTGSGSTVLGLVENIEKAKEILKKLRLIFTTFTFDVAKIL